MRSALQFTKLDLYTMKPFLKSYLVVVAMPIILMIANRSVVSGIVMVMMMMGIMATSIFSVEEKNDMQRLYSLLSVNRKDIVRGRYIYAALNGIAVSVIAAVLSFVTASICKISFEWAELMLASAIGIVIFTIIISIQLSLMFKMGYTKARFYAYLPYFIIAIVPMILSMASAAIPTGLIQEFKRVLDSMIANPAVFIIGCIVFSLILSAISYRISLRCYSKKEI